MNFLVTLSLLALFRLVSSLPVGTLSNPELRRRSFLVQDTLLPRGEDQEYVDIYARTGQPGYEIALHRSNVGTEHEHWALQFYPAGPAPPPKAKWWVVEALDAKLKSGILQVAKDPRKGYKPTLQGTNHLVVGTVTTAQLAEAAADIALSVKLTQKAPEQNCVDWVYLAVTALKNAGAMVDVGVQHLIDLYHAESEHIRQATAGQFQTAPVDKKKKKNHK